MRYVHSRHVLVFVEYERKRRDSSDGRQHFFYPSHEEALLPLSTCVKEYPGQLLDFLHTCIHLGEEETMQQF